MHIPILSICIATYNVEKYILQCLNSIKNKESTINKEIIIVDDKSSDSTIEKIHQRIQENPEIPTTLHSNKNNL
ncbi:MAG: glycosyltransferase [Candidatus Peribacteria bacterium]|jgi:glycosyltransferase involved in cell wall biosynthesis|nr:glycosyltransferase [Candidatus Peribacteria bacterium]